MYPPPRELRHCPRVRQSQISRLPIQNARPIYAKVIAFAARIGTRQSQSRLRSNVKRFFPYHAKDLHVFILK
jgi:hypothetical protein